MKDTEERIQFIRSLSDQDRKTLARLFRNGWALVPIKPTKFMLEEAQWAIWASNPEETWREMLEAGAISPTELESLASQLKSICDEIGVGFRVEEHSDISAAEGVVSVNPI